MNLRGRLLALFPWQGRVTRTTLRADATAGLIGALVVVPQGIAFATLAGLPVEYGLYAAMIPTIVAALCGSSWHAVTGPTNAVSLFVFATLAPLAVPGSARYITLALTVSFMAGLTMLAMGLLRMGRVVNFISHTVVVGFMAGAGSLIFASQLGNFFGVELPHGSAFLSIVGDFLGKLGTLNPYVLIVSGATLASGIAARRWRPRAPYMVVAFVIGTAVAAALDEWLGPDVTQIRKIGTVPSAFPPLSRPDFSPDTWRTLMGIAFGVTVLGLTEAMSIARALALKSGQRLDANREFAGQGLANIVASFFSGYPASASFNRSGINLEAGAQTPLAAASSALFLVAILFGVAPLLSLLPVASMSAILFLVAWGLFDVPAMRTIVRTSRGEAAVLFFTYAATLIMNLEVAILVGVTLSLIAYLNRTSRPQMRSLVPDPRHAERRFAPLADGLRECPQVKLLSIEGSIYFGATDHVESHFDTLREVAAEQKHLVVFARNVNFVDVAGAEALAREARKRRWEGGRLYLHGLRQPVQRILKDGGFIDEIGAENVFASKTAAVAGVFERLDRRICERCEARIFRECGGPPPPKDP